MLSRNKRLNLKKDFKWLRSGKKLEDDIFRMFYQFGNNQQFRLGIATPSKDFKLAVERNRARRLISKAFENIGDLLPSNLNILVFPSQKVLELSSEELTERLKKTLNEILINKYN